MAVTRDPAPSEPDPAPRLAAWPTARLCTVSSARGGRRGGPPRLFVRNHTSALLAKHTDYHPTDLL